MKTAFRGISRKYERAAKESVERKCHLDSAHTSDFPNAAMDRRMRRLCIAFAGASLLPPLLDVHAAFAGTLRIVYRQQESREDARGEYGLGIPDRTRSTCRNCRWLFRSFVPALQRRIHPACRIGEAPRPGVAGPVFSPMRHMDKRRIASTVLCLALLAMQGMSFAATNISIWTHAMFEAERGDYIDSVKSFNAENKDIRIELFFGLRRGRYGDQVEAAAEEGKLPCVFDFDGANLYWYVRAGKLVPLDQFPFFEELKKKMLWTAVQQGTFSGRLYAVGQYESSLAIWGNRKLLEKAGVRIPASPRETWSGEEFESVLKKLKDAGNAYPLGLRLDDASPEWTAYAMAPILQSHGGDLVGGQGYRSAEGFLNDAASVRALRMLQDWVRRGYADVSPSAENNFMQGRSALSYGEPSLGARYRRVLGDDLVLIPMPRFGAKAVTSTRTWSWGISSTCPEPAAAAKVIEYLMSEKEVARISDATGGLPVLPSVFARSMKFGANGPLKVYFDQLFEGMVHLAPQTPLYPAIATALHEAVAAIVKGGDVQRELDKAVRKIGKAARDAK